MAHPERAILRFMADSLQGGLFLSVPAAARAMGLGVKRVKAAVDAGQIVSVEVGKRKLIPRREIARLALVRKVPA